jgi:hypothetical protein
MSSGQTISGSSSGSASWMDSGAESEAAPKVMFSTGWISIPFGDTPVCPWM